MLHFCVYPGFTEENIDEIKETLVGSNLYLLTLTALVTALQVRLCNITENDSRSVCVMREQSDSGCKGSIEKLKVWVFLSSAADL